MNGIDVKFFKAPSQQPAPAKGSILVANPFLVEKWFDRSVIELVDYTPADGAMGVVMNLAIESTLQQLVDGVTIDRDIHVYCGGPLSQDRLYFLHTVGPEVIPGGGQVREGLWLGGDFEAALNYVNSGYPLDGMLRFFVGYSGWAKGQLEDEIEQGTWAVDDSSRATRDLLIGYGESYWHGIVRSLGPDYRSWLMVPHDSHKN